MTWTEYHPLEDMYTYLDYLEAEFDFVTTEEIGQSGEGRPMRVAKICRGECGSKPAVWIDGGIHAREGVSPPTTTSLRTWTGSSSPLPTLMATTGQGTTTGCG